MIDVNLIYPDCDTIERGYLYLPSEPVFITEWDSGCALCGDLVSRVTDYVTGDTETQDPTTGQHRGVVAILTEGTATPREYCHLRCLTDCVEQGSLGITMGAAEIGIGGRHSYDNHHAAA